MLTRRHIIGLLPLLILTFSSLFQVGISDGSHDLRAVFTYAPPEPYVNQQIAFNASASTGNITSFRWDFGDTTADLGMLVNHTYTAAGSYLVTLNVTDSEGTWATESEEIEVLEEPSPQDALEAEFSFSPSHPYLQELISFDASESTGNITRYEWDFGDQSTGSGVTVDHTYTAAGTYSVRLNVSDNEGHWAVKAKDVEVFHEEDPLTEGDEQTWVKMMGFVNPFPPPGVYKLRAYAKAGEWAKVYAFYRSENYSKGGPKTMFTYSFYAVRLVTASQVELNSSGCDFYVAGTWDVYNVSYIHYDHKNVTWTLEVMADDEDGTFCVADSWQNFTITITGMNPVDGRIAAHVVKTKRAIPEGDVNWDHKVNIVDVAAVGKAYGAMPGTPHFDFELDLDGNFQIDIIDIAKVAKDFGQEY